jgi:hypothetical protein
MSQAGAITATADIHWRLEMSFAQREIGTRAGEQKENHDYSRDTNERSQ